MLLGNKNYNFSYAENKYRWGTTEDGDNERQFDSVHLAEWFRVYNQTSINKVTHLKSSIF